MTFAPRLSGLRGAASLWVGGYHALASVGVFLPLVAGWTGVAVFFALSAYLLLGRLDAKPHDLRRYFVRRVVRIWPLYMATCLLVWLTVDGSVRHLVLNLAFVGIWVPNGQFTTGTTWDPSFVLWTLQVEEAAYLCLPFIARLPHVWRVRTGLALLGTTAGVSVALPLLPMALTGPSGGYTAPWLWVGFYGVGLLVYEGWRPSNAPFALGVFVVGGLASASLWAPWTVAVVAALPLVGYLLAHPPRLLGSRPMVYVGETSYGLYLVHALWVQALGPLGLLGGEAMASGMELSTRRREILRRVFSRRRSRS
ncbi:MAG: acyltransferase [Thermoplasmata archaeon]|nr:acyltransferase [Thermoplasmata archaeon]